MMFRPISWLLDHVHVSVVAALLAAIPVAAQAQPVLTIDMLTWHVVGLDSNNPLVQGPDEFLSGARVCNTGADPANDITASYIFDTANSYIDISPRGTDVLTAPFLLAGQCQDFYFLLRVRRTPLAYNTTREFHIEVSAANHPTISTPQPRELFVEHLISQNRNDVLSVTGPTNVYVGQIVEYTVLSDTATQGYEQLSSFLNFSNLLFQVMSVDVSYSAPPGATNDKVYADACGWDDLPGPTPPVGTYRSCAGPAQYPGGKAGGDITTVYRIKFLSTGTSSVVETIYDFSGSSYHYNADVGLDAINISSYAPLADIQFNKHCNPDPVSPGGSLTCIIEYGNNSVSTTYTGVEINETYDRRTTFVSAVPAPDNAPANDHWTIGTLAPGDYGTIVLTLSVDAGANDGDNLLNRATINDDVSAANNSAGDPAGAFKAAETLTPVAVNAAGSALLRVTKTGVPDPEVGAGSQIVYTINYQNAGLATSYATVLTDTLQTGLTFVSSVPAPDVSAAPSYSWNLGNLAPGASGSITVTVGTDSALTTATIVENQVLLVGNPGLGTNDTAGLTAYAEEIQFIRGGAQAIADVSIDKTDAAGSDPIVQGGALPYVLTVHNNGPDVATGVVVTDLLSPNTTYTSSSLPCVQAPAGTLTCDLGDVAAGATVVLTIGTVVSPSAPTAGTLQTSPCDGTEDLCNRASVASTTTDPTPGNNSADEPTNVTAVANICNLSLTKTDGTDPVAPGANLTYTISVTNNGPDNAADVTIRDALDPNTTYVSDTFPSACSVDANGVATCTYASLPAGATRTRTITVQVSATAPSAGSLQTAPCNGTEDLCNRIVASYASDCKDLDPSDNTPTQPTDVTRPSSNLSITKTDVGSDPVVQGGTVTYAISVTNAGPDAADDVVVVDTLDTDTAYISDTAPGGCVEAPAGTLTCSLGGLALAASTSFNLTVLVSGSAPTAGTTQVGLCAAPGVDICNSATASSYSTDPVTADNTAEQPTNVTAVSADLSIAKSDTGDDPLREGGILTYTVTVTNAGPDAANNVQVVDILDSNEFYLEDTASGGCVEAPAGTLTCALGTIASGASVPFQITVFAPTGTPTAGTLQASPCNGSEDLCNNATVSASTTDPNPANNADDEPTDVEPAQADVQITKDDTGYDPIGRGSNVIYTIHVSNPGPDDAQDVVVTDVLDSATTYVSDDFGCVEAPAGTLTCDLGAMLAGQSQDIQVTATVTAGAPTAGTLSAGPCDGSEDICNNVSVSASTTDTDPTNNSASEPTDVSPDQADLSVTKTDATDPVAPGATEVYSVTVSNTGPQSATDVVVTDTLDPDTTYVSDTGGCTLLAPVDGVFADCAAGAAPGCPDPYPYPPSNLFPTVQGRDNAFNIFVGGNLTVLAGGAEMEGGIFVGGDLSVTKNPGDAFNMGLVGAGSYVVPDDGTDFVTVGGNLSASAAVNVIFGGFVGATDVPGNLRYKGTLLSGSFSPGDIPGGTDGQLIADPAMDLAPFQAAAAGLESRSACLDAQPTSANAAFTDDGFGTYTFASTDGASGLYVFNVAQDLDPGFAGSIVFDNFPQDATVLVNMNKPGSGETITVNAATLTFTNMVGGGSEDRLAERIAWNFPDAAAVNLSGASQLRGAVLAGSATSTLFVETSLNGRVATAGNLSMGATAIGLELHNYPLRASLPASCDVRDSLTCNLGAIASGGSTTFTITVTVSATAPTGGTLSAGPCDGSEDLCNEISVTATQADPDPTDNTDSEPTDVSSQADVAITKTGPASATPGANVVYTITVLNNGTGDAEAVSVADTTPAGLSFVSNAGDCVVAYPCALGTVAAGATRTITTTYSVPSSYTTPDPLLNTATVSSTTSDPSPANNTSTSSTPIVASADLSIAKSDATDPIAQDGTQVYSLTVSNAGPSDASAVVVNDTLDAETTYASDTGGCAHLAGVLTCNLGAIAAGASTTFTVTVQVSATAPTAGTLSAGPCDGSEDICNDADVAAAEPDPDPSDNSDSEPSDVTPAQADVSVTKSDSPDPVSQGGTLVYTVTVSNAGPSAATDVVVTDVLDAEEVLVSNTGGCVEAPAGTLTCDLGTLAAGATTNFTIVATVGAGAPTAGTLSAGPCDGSEDICNNVSVTATQDDPVLADNDDSEPTDVIPGATGPTMTKTDSPDPVTAGGVLTYTINYSNPTAATLDNVTITETYDPRTTFSSATPDPDIGDSIWVIGSLDPGQVGTITIVTTVDGGLADGTTLSNSAVLDADGFSALVVTEPTTVAATGAGTALLHVSKGVSPSSVPSGGIVTYTITVGNAGPATAYDVVASDVLPSGTTYMNAMPAPAVQAGQYVEWSVGDLAAGAAQSFQVFAETSASLAAGYLLENCADGAGSTGPGTIYSSGLASEGCAASSTSGGGTDCSLVMKKRHIGTPMPGAQITYRCLWCDPCVDASGVSITDYVPAGIEIVSVSSEESHTIDHDLNTVTIDIPVLPAGRAGVAYITVNIPAGVEANTVLTNQILLRDAALREKIGTDIAVVASPGQNPPPPSSSSARTTLSVTGSKRAIAGGTVNATVRYRNVGAGSSMTALLSPDVELVRVTPQPTTIDGSLLAWSSVGPTGVVKIRGKAQLPSLAARGGIISMDVALANAATGQIMTSGLDAPVIVPAIDPFTSTKALSVVLGGARYVTPGVETSLTLRYRNLATGGEAVINLPVGLTFVSALPTPSTTDGAQLRWNSILPGSGTIKIRAAVSAGLASGTPLAVGTTILSDAGGNVGDEFEMKVR